MILKSFEEEHKNLRHIDSIILTKKVAGMSLTHSICAQRISFTPFFRVVGRVYDEDCTSKSVSRPCLLRTAVNEMWKTAKHQLDNGWRSYPSSADLWQVSKVFGFSNDNVEYVRIGNPKASRGLAYYGFKGRSIRVLDSIVSAMPKL